MIYLVKYATGTGLVISRPLLKRTAADYAVSADITLQAGDVKVKIDGAAVANIATLPTFVTSGNTAYLEYTFSDAELTGKRIRVTFSDSPTEAAEDDFFELHTFGHTSALYPTDYSVANAAQTGDGYARLGANGAGLTALGDIRLANLDAAVSSRLASGSYTAPDNTGIGTAATEAAAAAASAASADGKATTILARLGAWTGSARNTILGAFQALFRKDVDAAMPSDVNADLGSGAGTADNTTDSNQSIADAVAGAPAALLDLAAGVETGVTLRQALRIILAAEAGKLSGAATTTIVIRNPGDTKDRITATVDADGNRSAVVLDAS
jgi:hypothetical protein